MKLYPLVLLFVASPALAREPKKVEDPRELATKYVLALTDAHDQSGKDYLLGGLTLDAVTATALDPQIAGQDPKKSETGELEELNAAIALLDKAGPLGDKPTLDAARALLDKTKAERKAFIKKFPVLANVIRADRPLYWNPKNPMRVLLTDAPKTGTFQVDYVAFTVKSKESSGKTLTWPLRVVRFKTEGIDTGWKVLPASQWDPE